MAMAERRSAFGKNYSGNGNGDSSRTYPCLRELTGNSEGLQKYWMDQSLRDKMQISGQRYLAVRCRSLF